MNIPQFIGYIRAGLGNKVPYAQDVTIPRGETCTGSIEVRRDDDLPANLTGGALVLTAHGLFGREMDFTDSSVGTATFPISIGDTFHAERASYKFEVLFIDNAGIYGEAGGHYYVIPPSSWNLSETLSDETPTQNPAPSPGTNADRASAPASCRFASSHSIVSG